MKLYKINEAHHNQTDAAQEAEKNLNPSINLLILKWQDDFPPLLDTDCNEEGINNHPAS